MFQLYNQMLDQWMQYKLLFLTVSSTKCSCSSPSSGQWRLAFWSWNQLTWKQCFEHYYNIQLCFLPRLTQEGLRRYACSHPLCSEASRKTNVGNQEWIDVNTCHVWFHTTAAYTLQTDLTLTNPMCAPCKQLFKHMREAAQSAILISPEERSKRVQPESPITQLSPASQNLRKQLQCSEKHSLTKTLSSVQQQASHSWLFILIHGSKSR